MTNVTTPVPKANFTAALGAGCTESCAEVTSVAEKALAEYHHPVTPKAYCRLHEDWLEKVGIYDVDAFFALLLGKATDAEKAQVRSSGKYPAPLQATRDENNKIFDILSRKPESPEQAGAWGAALALALLAVSS